MSRFQNVVMSNGSASAADEATSKSCTCATIFFHSLLQYLNSDTFSRLFFPTSLRGTLIPSAKGPKCLSWVVRTTGIERKQDIYIKGSMEMALNGKDEGVSLLGSLIQTVPYLGPAQRKQ